MLPDQIASIEQLQKVRSVESGERLVDLAHFSPNVRSEVRRGDEGLSAIWVRETVARKLESIQMKLQALDPRYGLLVVEGYRSPSYQEKYYLQHLLLEHQKDPSLRLEVLMERVHAFVALPSVAGHPTGGAVDVTLIWEGQEVDMGGEIADFSDPSLLPTYSPALSPAGTENRKLLHDLMVSEHFAPYLGEWWHFSYGDREWAAFYDLEETLYANTYVICS